MILISSHIDRVIQEYDLSFSNGIHKGLLDNIAGILLTYLVLYDDQNLIDLEKEGKLKIWHGKGEEWGILKNPPKLTKKDLVIVVDIADEDNCEGKDFTLENISGLSDTSIKELKDNIEWQGMSCKTKKYNANPEDADESWQWIELGIPVISFGIPIKGDFHSIKMDNTVTVGKMKICRQGLKRVINHFI